MRQQNHWHPCLLPAGYIRKLKQDLVESDAVAESATRLEPEPEHEVVADDG